jgi:hypothetical protein
VIRSTALCLALLFTANLLRAQNYHLDRRGNRFPHRLELVEEAEKPLIGPDYAGLGDIQSGFETGVTVKEGGTYHLFISEMYGRHHLDMRIGHWTSPDATRWTRQGTAIPNVPGRSHLNHKAEAWMQALVFDEKTARWQLFYIAYRGGNPEKGEVLNLDYEGVVWRAVSQTPGRAGIGGPYRDAEIVMKPDATSMDWEGQQGLDSFFPYPIGNGSQWVTLHGSRNHHPPSPWRVGVATGKSLFETQWQRVKAENPSGIETLFIENPIVLRLPTGEYLAVYDTSNWPAYPEYPARPDNTVGYSVSKDGIHWPQGKALVVQSRRETNWSADLRTPLGLVPEPDGTFTLLYTARMKDREFWAIGKVRVKLVN